VFWIILYFFLLTIFFLYVAQFQMIWNFLSMYPTCLKEWIQRVTTILDIFFLYKCGLVNAAAHFFVGPQKGFLSIHTLISCNLHSEKFWIFFYIFSKQFTTRSYSYICPKNYFFQKFGTCTRNGRFGAFLWKHSMKPLGVKWC